MTECQVSRLQDEVAELQERLERLRLVVAECGVTIESLHAAVVWELAPEVKDQIAATVSLVRAALGDSK